MSKLHKELGIKSSSIKVKTKGSFHVVCIAAALYFAAGYLLMPVTGLSSFLSIPFWVALTFWLKGGSDGSSVKIRMFLAVSAITLLLSVILAIGFDGGGAVGYSIVSSIIFFVPDGIAFGKVYLSISILAAFLFARMVSYARPVYSFICSDNSSNADKAPSLSKNGLVVKGEKRDILLGYDKDGTAVYWRYLSKRLTNRHMVIYGKSGNGKSYLIQRLVSALTSSYSTALIDIKPSFTFDVLEDKFKENTPVKQYYLAVNPVSLNPFSKRNKKLDDGVYKMDSSYDIASRVASVFSSVYSTMGDQQVATLIRAITDGIDEKENFNFNNLINQLCESSIDDNEKIVPRYKGGDVLANKIEPLVNANIFSDGKGHWGDIFNSDDKKASVLQFAEVNDTVKKIASEFLLWGMYDYALSEGDKHSPLPIIMDESHNVKYHESSPSYKMLKEGRSFGVSLIMATQSPSSDKNELKVIDQAAHKIIFKPTDDDQDYFAKVLHKSDNSVSIQDWKARLAKLGQGECYSLGLEGVSFVKIPAM